MRRRTREGWMTNGCRGTARMDGASTAHDPPRTSEAPTAARRANVQQGLWRQTSESCPAKGRLACIYRPHRHGKSAPRVPPGQVATSHRKPRMDTFHNAQMVLTRASESHLLGRRPPQAADAPRMALRGIRKAQRLTSATTHLTCTCSGQSTRNPWTWTKTPTCSRRSTPPLQPSTQKPPPPPPPLLRTTGPRQVPTTRRLRRTRPPRPRQQGRTRAK